MYLVSFDPALDLLKDYVRNFAENYSRYNGRKLFRSHTTVGTAYLATFGSPSIPVPSLGAFKR